MQLPLRHGPRGFMAALSYAHWMAGGVEHALQEYRAYTLDPEGHLKDFIEFFVPDDDAAVAYARQKLDHHDVEVWLTRIVARRVPTPH